MGIAFSDVAGVWPWHGGLIAAAVVVYVLLHGALAEFAVPLLTRQTAQPLVARRTRSAGVRFTWSVRRVAAGLVDAARRAVVGVAPGGRGVALLRVSDLRGLCESAGGGASPPRSPRVPRRRHVGRRPRWPRHRVERRARPDAGLFAGARAGAVCRSGRSGARPHRPAESDQGHPGRRQAAIDRRHRASRLPGAIGTWR